MASNKSKVSPFSVWSVATSSRCTTSWCMASTPPPSPRPSSPATTRSPPLMLSLATFGAGFPDAAAGCGVPGRLHRSPRPPPGPDHHPRPDGHGHPADRLRSRLCHAGRGGAVAGAVRPAPAGFFRRRRAGRGFGLPVGDRHARTQRLLRQLAVGQPAGRGGLRRPARRAPQPVAEPAGHGRMGLARAVLHRLPDRSGAVSSSVARWRKRRSSRRAPTDRRCRRCCAPSGRTSA